MSKYCKKDGREVLPARLWLKRRLQVLASAAADGYSLCMGCGAPIDESFECHHEGGRGLGGGKRDDREFIPGIEDQWNEFPFMPESPEGMRRNLFALCYRCHKGEHHQGCSGTLQWSKDANRETTDPIAEEADSSLAIIDEADALGDRATNGH